ncbi:restriction endonuclease subunit S [Helicobacter pylori]|uniref:restriction endonuclease subunit S n=1 Tax=Helicobacter pylori TaxID=210 RepID=UPI00046D0A00|nr:restriction endonuclease subunit S [Helicobacter pylori]
MDALTTPSNWQRVRLGDILELLTDYHANGSYEILKNNVTLLKNVDFAIMIRTTNFENNDFKNDLIYIDKKAYEFLSKSKVFAGDILVNKIANAGTAYFMPKLNQPVSLGMNLFLLRIKPSYNNLFIFKQIANYERVLKTFANGSATKTITKNVIKNLLIPLPPLNEQIAIANILSDVDRYLYSLDALILKKESVKKALSFELLSQRKRLKGFNQNWQRVRLGDIAEIKRGASPRPIENPKWFCTNSNVGWVRISDISKNSRFLYKTAQKLSKKGIEKSRFVKQNSLIMSMCATIGKPIITKIDTCIHDGFVVFENPKIDLNYLYYFLCYIEKEWLESGQQGSQVNLNVDLIKNKEVFCPKDLDEQIAIANILSGLDHEIISLKNKKRQFENIKKALNHDLMSAKIRVLKK